jgi:hypothetical protein
MKKTILLLVALILSCPTLVQASTDLRPLNVQNATMGNDKGENAELRINFDWFRDHQKLSSNPTTRYRSNTMALPRIDIRQACTDCPVPFRIGLNTAMMLGFAEIAQGSRELAEASAFGFGNLGLTLEAQLFQTDDSRSAMNVYINQHFPWIHNDRLLADSLRPQYGANAYGFQTGLLYQFGLGDHLSLFGDVGYRFDVPKTGAVQHSLVYYNEVMATVGDDQNFGISLGLLGNSVYTDNIGTDLRLVPALAAKVGGNSQLRVGLPIGLNPDSPNLGLQVGYFTAF